MKNDDFLKETYDTKLPSVDVFKTQYFLNILNNINNSNMHTHPYFLSLIFFPCYHTIK